MASHNAWNAELPLAQIPTLWQLLANILNSPASNSSNFSKGTTIIPFFFPLFFFSFFLFPLPSLDLLLGTIPAKPSFW